MKKESSFKMKGFSGFGNSPVKQKQQAKAKNVRNIYSAAGKVDMTLNDKLNEAVRKRSASYARPRIEAQKARGTKQIVGRGVVSKKPASLASRAFRGFKNVAKVFGKRATGVAGMMMGTMGTALGNTQEGGIGYKGEEAARRLFNKRTKK